MSKLVNLYLDWQDRTSFVGVGKVLRRLDTRPIIKYEDNYYQPRRCLVKIVKSDKYNEGFNKHFIIPFSISAKEAERLIKKESKLSNTSTINFMDEILSHDNPIVDTKEEIELREFVLWVRRSFISRNTRVPKEFVDQINERKKECDQYRHGSLYKQSEDN